jgi:hypothetical protein
MWRIPTSARLTLRSQSQRPLHRSGPHRNLTCTHGLSETLLGVDLGIDQLLFRDPEPGLHGVGGRMAPATAASLLFTGAALARSHAYPDAQPAAGSHCFPSRIP